MTLPYTIAAYSCSRPFYKLLADAVTRGDAPMDWVMCPYTITGIGLQGFGFFLVLAIGGGMMNWSESFKLPAVWVVLAGGVMATMLPGALLSKLYGFIVAAVAMLFIGIIFYFR